MDKRWTVNALLFVVALGIGILLWAQGHHAPLPRAPAPLIPIKVAALSTISVQRPGHAAILLRRSGTHWFLLKPLKARADQFRVEALTDVLDAGTRDHFAVPQKKRLAAFGLAPPQAVLTLDQKQVLIGKRRPFGDLRYILVNHTVALVPAETIHPRRLNTDSFLSTELLSTRVHPLSFTLPRFTVRRKEGIWRVLPKPVKVSNDRINAFVDGWRYARALSVTRYHGQRPIGRIVIDYRLAKAHKLLIRRLIVDILSTSPELVLLRPDQGLEYHFPAEIGQRLLHLSAHAGTS